MYTQTHAFSLKQKLHCAAEAFGASTAQSATAHIQTES